MWIKDEDQSSEDSLSEDGEPNSGPSTNRPRNFLSYQVCFEIFCLFFPQISNILQLLFVSFDSICHRICILSSLGNLTNIN